MDLSLSAPRGSRDSASSNARFTWSAGECPASTATRCAKCFAWTSTSALFINSKAWGATVERVRWLHDETMSGWSNASNIG